MVFRYVVNILKSSKYRDGKTKEKARKVLGFTLMEILIVIAIIGVLASVVLGNINTARAKGKEGKAKAELRNIRTAIALLEDDTGKWPNGCPPSTVSNPEVELDTSQAGISQQPNIGDQGNGCEWVAADIAKWKGPYMKTPIDPWGNSYWFDPDYRPGDDVDSSENCDEGTAAINDIVTVVSFGPNGIGNNKYDCDDIYLEI